MAKKTKSKPSQQIIDEAMQVTLATQKPGQSKEQSKLIAQGIEKGIAQYKKQQKEKARSANKAKKQSLKNKAKQDDGLSAEHASDKDETQKHYLPWIIVVISWAIFGAYILSV